MNFLQLVNRAKREAQRSGGALASVSIASGDDLLLCDQVAEEWLALQRRPHGWKWMRREMTNGAIVAGQRDYTAVQLVPGITDFGRWYPAAVEGYFPQLVLASGATVFLKWMPWELFRARIELQTHQPTTPTFWSVDDTGKFYVGPTPNENGTLKASYYAAATELLEDDDLPAGLPVEFHMILVWGALIQLASIDAASEVYTRALMNFENIDTDLRFQQAPTIYVKASPL